jgi:Nuclease-related domain
MTLNNALMVLVYLSLFAACVVTLVWWKKQQRIKKAPFAEGLKLLRTSGETQLEKVRMLEDLAVLWMLGAALVPVLVFMGLMTLTVKLPETIQPGGFAVALLAALAVFYASARWFAGRSSEIGNRYLGYFGERVVAELLEPLKAQGWRIFHDVPAIANAQSFNIDHVAVGPGGVFVIETKTRRKGAARPGFEAHKVYFDGHALVWPWGEDNHGLDQAERNATWLADTLLAETGERLPVTPVLTLPGWWVEMKPSRDPRRCQVLNPKNLPAMLSGGANVVTPAQFAAIVARLEARCRNVEF